MDLKPIAAAIMSFVASFSGRSTTPIDGAWTSPNGWQRQEDSYVITASSESVPSDCRRDPKALVEFPSIIHGAHKVYLDGVLIEKYGDPEFKKTRSFFGAPVISCEQIAKGKSLTWEGYSYTEIFTHISNYPRVAQRVSLSPFIAEALYLLGAGAMLLLSIIVAFFFWKKTSHHLTIVLSTACLGAALYQLFTVPGLLGLDLSMKTAHRIADLSAWISLILFFHALWLHSLVNRALYLITLIFAFSGMAIIAAAKTGDSIQIGTNLGFIPGLALCFNALFQLIKKTPHTNWNGYRIFQVASLLTFTALCTNDALYLLGFTNSKLLFPIAIIFGLSFFTLAINAKIDEAIRERDYLRSHLEQEVQTKTRELVQAEEIRLGELQQLASRVAHDIRSPIAALNVVAGDLQTVPESTRELMQASFQRINEIANQLLSKSRRKAANEIQTRVLKPVRVHALVRSIEQVVYEKKTEHKIAPKISISCSVKNSESEEVVFIDKTNFESAISNLINNAIEATDPNGQIICEIIRPDTDLQIEIRDTGKGIPMLILKKLGLPGVTHGKTSGNGLGLYFARQTIEGAGGSLTIASEINVGTTVKILLPLS